MQGILDTLVDERGKCCLEYLRASSDEEVKTQLTRFESCSSIVKVGRMFYCCIVAAG
jgi:hypothetical protein